MSSIFWKFLWQLLVHCLSIYLFTTGFFLTRYELKHMNMCDTLPISNKSKNDNAPFDGGCWAKPRFKRLVIVLIDALRDDFARFDEAFQTTVSAGASADHRLKDTEKKLPKETQKRKFYTNHLTVMRNTIIKNPKRSRLYRFVADPPTVTMQRLKGLTTGGLPTFIDFKDNFGSSSSIDEDNLILQLKNRKKKVVFMGDDTWLDLFNASTDFVRSYPYPSFNVKDLDTVDDGVIKHLLPEIKGLNGNWDVIIAHFLGVDHCGHRYGPSHPEMSRKLDQMNNVLQEIIDTIEDDTLLAVFGDHGMTSHGDHGGSTEAEIASSLFLYSGGPPLRTFQYSRNGKGKPFPYFNISSTTIDDTKNLLGINSVSQIDLVPTLSLLLGLPIPYGNLGRIIPELFFHPSSKYGTDKSLLKKMDVADKTLVCSDLSALNKWLDAVRLNAHQSHQYIMSYSKISKALTEDLLKPLEDLFHKAEKMYKQNRINMEKLIVACDGGTGSILQFTPNEINLTDAKLSIVDAVSTLKEFDAYLSQNVSLFRRMWTQFNLFSMSFGIFYALILFGTNVSWALGHFYDSEYDKTWHLELSTKNIFLTTSSGCIAYILFQKSNGLPLVSFQKTSFAVFFVTVMNVAFLLNFCSWFAKDNAAYDNKNSIKANITAQSCHGSLVLKRRLKEFWNLPQSILNKDFFVCVLAIIYCISFTSNSYIGVHMDILSFFIAVASCAYSAGILPEFVARFEAKKNAVGRRVSLSTIVSWSNIQFLLLPAGLLVSSRVLKAFPCRGQENSINGGLHVFRSLFPVVVVPLFAYLQMMYGNVSPKNVEESQKREDTFNFLRFFVFSESFGASVWTVIYWAAIERGITDNFYSVRILLPRAIAAFGILTSCCSAYCSSKNRDDLFGHNWLWTLPLVSPVMLLLGPHSPLVLLLYYMQFFCLFKLLHLDTRIYSQTKDGTQGGFPFMRLCSFAVLCWLIIEYAFYVSGHVSNFNGLHISAAYVGLDKFSFVFSGSLLFLNTFIVTILSTALVFTGIDSAYIGKRDRDVLVLILGALYSFLLFVVMSFTLFVRRHLMVWAIFAPKFVFTATTIIVVDISLLLCMCFSKMSSGRKIAAKRGKQQ